MQNTIVTLSLLLALSAGARAQTENYESWPVLKSTFPSTGGGGIMIKGYDPVIIGNKCVTTFMAVEPNNAAVYPNYIEFEAVAVRAAEQSEGPARTPKAAGGTLCRNGKWRAFEGGASGETPFRLFFKDGVWRGQ
jgi:hypothetical protein